MNRSGKPEAAPRRTHTGRYVLLIFRDGRFLRSIGAIKRRLTIGSDRWCDVVLDDAEVAPRWGTIADLAVGVLLEPPDGRVRPLPLLEPFAVGPFVLVRAAADAHVPALARELEARFAGGLAKDAKAEPAPKAEAQRERADVKAKQVAAKPAPSPMRKAAAPPPKAASAPPAEPQAPPPPQPEAQVAAGEALTSLFGGPAPSRDAFAGDALADEGFAELEAAPPGGALGGLGGAPASGRGYGMARAGAGGGAAATSSAAAFDMPAMLAAAIPPPPPPPTSVPAPAQAMPLHAAPSVAARPSPARAPAGAAIGLGALGARRSAGPRAPADDGANAAPAVTPLSRRTTVRHFSTMNPGRTFPLLVIISAGRVERTAQREVAQVESKTGFTVTRESPLVRVEPVIPGCAVAPSTLEVDCTAALAEARFTVTPIIEGVLADARVEVRHEGKLVDTVPIPTRVAKQTAAKVSAAFSAASPFAMKALMLGDAHGGGLSALAHAAADAAGGGMRLGAALATAGALAAIVLWRKNRAREAAPITHLLDYSTATAASGDLALEKLKARLVVLAESGRALVPLAKRRTTIGRAPSCDVVVADASLAPEHAAIEFDGESLRLRALAGAKIRLETRSGLAAPGEVDELDLGRDEVAFRLGKVPFLFAREVASPLLEGNRERIVEALVARLAGFEAEIRAAFADPQRPVRACVADLLARGRLDLALWQEVAAQATS